MFDFSIIEKIFEKKFSRRSFVKLVAALFALTAFSSKKAKSVFAKETEYLEPRKKRQVATACDAVVAKGKNAAAITRKAIEELGGMGRFVKKGDTVVVKPNIGWDRVPEQAACTNPDVVATIIKMCFESGAKTVKVFDYTCNACERTYRNSGLFDAAKKAGATVSYVADWKFIPGRFPKGSPMEDWSMFRDAVMCDCFINVPIAKHHKLTHLTLGIKNLMGVCGGSRGSMHWGIADKLADVCGFINPDLTVVDAYRILLRNGPLGGDLNDVAEKDTVIASADPVLADSYATTLFGLKPEDIGYINASSKKGLGNMNLSRANIRQVMA
jgi:uncharacterized protein (DUF362 family)